MITAPLGKQPYSVGSEQNDFPGHLNIVLLSYTWGCEPIFTMVLGSDNLFYLVGLQQSIEIHMVRPLPHKIFLIVYSCPPGAGL